jgi:AcrR family transcriptional regulator
MKVTASRKSKRAPIASPAVGIRGYRIRDVARAEERRREILMGAARAFAHGGYDATNMDQIARACGLAKGHIYHYFRSKEEIFTEIRTDAVSRLIQRLTPIATAAAKDPELALRKAIAAVIARIFDPEERYELGLPDPVSLSAQNRKRIRTLGRRYEQMFANILRTGMNKGTFVSADPKLTTFVILRAAFTVATWYREGGKWKPQWIVDQVTEQLVRSVTFQ